MHRALVSPLFAITLLAQSTVPGKWMAGDFHQHTLFTDGSHPIHTVIGKGFANGLHFQTNSEHGGAFARNAEGKPWTVELLGDPPPRRGPDPIRAMWRWQMLRDHAFPEITRLRQQHPDKLILTGLEWNVPSHEHASTAILAKDSAAIAQFEYLFDGGDQDVSGGAAQGWTGKRTANDHAKAVTAVAWMQQHHAGRGYVVFAHADRQSSYKIQDYRDFNNAGPDVAFGFEGIPGHQKQSPRGGYSDRAFGGATYGGAGIAVAQIGGTWDALLGEGRRFWNFVSSDFHSEKGDFWPGEYAKTWVYVKDLNRDGRQDETEVIAALASGNSFAVHGELIDQLGFQVRRGKQTATMGETLTVKRGATVDIEISVHTPARNLHGDAPKLDHIDLISGNVTGKVAPESAAYANGTNPSAKQIARFNAKGKTVFRYRLKNVTQDLYLRLRGTNLAAETPEETDAQGNPLSDFLAVRNLKLDPETAAWRDLWFYSNPVFVKVQ